MDSSSLLGNVIISASTIVWSGWAKDCSHPPRVTVIPPNKFNASSGETPDDTMSDCLNPLQWELPGSALRASRLRTGSQSVSEVTLKPNPYVKYWIQTQEWLRWLHSYWASRSPVIGQAPRREQEKSLQELSEAFCASWAFPASWDLWKTRSLSACLPPLKKYSFSSEAYK